MSEIRHFVCQSYPQNMHFV